MKAEVYTCDVCGAVKADANHWWRAYYSQNRKRLELAPFDDLGSAYQGEEFHLCGRACVLRKVEEFMGQPPRTSGLGDFVPGYFT